MNEPHQPNAKPEENLPSYSEATGQASRDGNVAQHQSTVDYESTDEKTAMKQDDTYLLSCSGPSAGPLAPSKDFKFTVHVSKPFLGNTTMTIVPTHPLKDVGLWQLRYTSKLNANLRRHAGSPQHRLVLREIADIKFPELIIPGCGPIIRYQPHEDEISRKGMRHTSPTDVFMWCTGVLTTRYRVDFPLAFPQTAVTWVVADGKDAVQLRQRNENSDGWLPATTSSSSEKHTPPAAENASGITEVQMGGSRIAREDSWTPFLPQSLIREQTGEVLATYARAAPWDQVTGWLTIPQLPDPAKTHYSEAEFIEAVVIVCAAMVGMQDRIGLTGSVIEAGFDNLRSGGKGKGKADVGKTASS